MMNEFKNVPAVEKAIKILKYYTTTTTPYIGVTEIANALSMSKGTVYSILNTMANYDFIIKSRISGNYALGPGIKEISNAYEHHDILIECFRSIVNQYRNIIPETMMCTFLECELVHVLASVPPRDTYLAVNIPAGAILSPVNTSAGKVLLSRFDDSSVDRMYDLHAPSLPSIKIPDKEEYLRSVRFVRRHGYCFDEREYGEGVYGIACPLRNSSGNLIAAINISVPHSRLTTDLKNKYVQALLKISNETRIPY